MKENITDKEKKKIEEMTNELVAIVPMVKPKEDSYTDYCKQIATALRNVGYSKETIIVKEFAEKIMEKNCRNCEHAFLETCKGCNTLPPNNTYENFELRKDITAEKNRADVAEEALRNGAVGEDLYCSSDYERERLYLHLLKEAEARLKEEE